jgi:DNA-binding GntR family transcriptional regulator
VELALLELACRSVSKDLIEQMEENLKEQEEAAQREDIIEFFRRTMTFIVFCSLPAGKKVYSTRYA